MINNYHIFYQKNTNFQIIPKLDDVTRTELENLFSQLKLFYAKFGGFFWKLDSDKCHIIVDDTNNEIASDFNNHLIKIISWLYQRGYTITGSFYFRNLDAIDYTKIKNSVIKNHIILDPLNISELVIDTESKIKKYLTKLKNNKRRKINRLEKKMSNTQFYYGMDVAAYVCLFFTYTMLLYKSMA